MSQAYGAAVTVWHYVKEFDPGKRSLQEKTISCRASEIEQMINKILPNNVISQLKTGRITAFLDVTSSCLLP